MKMLLWCAAWFLPVFVPFTVSRIVRRLRLRNTRVPETIMGSPIFHDTVFPHPADDRWVEHGDMYEIGPLRVGYVGISYGNDKIYEVSVNRTTIIRGRCAYDYFGAIKESKERRKLAAALLEVPWP